MELSSPAAAARRVRFATLIRAALPLRLACAQTLHAGVLRDEARLAAKRAQLAAERTGAQGP
jgi:hypothetical protein